MSNLQIETQMETMIESRSGRPQARGMKRQFAWSIAPLLVTTALNLFSVRLFFKYLGDDMYALLGYVITFTGMFGFADMGFGVAVGRYVGVALGKGDRAAVREYWGTGNLVAVPMLAIMGLVFAGLGVFFGPHWFNVAPANEAVLRSCFVAGGFALFLNYYGQFWFILSQAHLDFKFIALLRMGATVFQIVPAIIIAGLTKNPFLITLWGVLIGLVQLIAFVWHARRQFGLGFELRQARVVRLREMASYIGKTFAMLLVGSAFGSIDRLVLGKLAPATDFANYTNGAANVGQRLQGLGASIMGPVFYNTTRAVGGKDSPAPAQIYNETFHFVFPWYALIAIWAAIWHPLLLQLWLGAERASQISPIFTPMIVAFCLTAISHIGVAQLGALNRQGTALGFAVAIGLFTGLGVYVGWHLAGVVGVAYGFLCSRIVNLAQDLFTILLIKADGWFSRKTWEVLGAQLAVGALFACSYLFLPRTSLWVSIPALLHGGLIASWLSRHYLRKYFGASLRSDA